MRSSDDAAGGGKATVCAAAGRHQHVPQARVTSVRKKSSLERKAYATQYGFLPPDQNRTPQSTTAQTGGYRA
jgi:hypothetical protein